MLNTYLTEDLIRTQQSLPTWEDAIRLGGSLLVAKNQVEPAYIQAMIDAVHTHGPYIAIAPGIAIAHAAPGAHVNEDCLALVTLSKAVPIGHDMNDPIGIFFIVAAKNHEGHLSFLQELVTILSDEEKFQIIKTSSTKDVLALFNSKGDVL